MVKINGKDLPLVNTRLDLYLADSGYDSKRVAVECNGCIVPKAQYGTTILRDGDTVEIVSFVGGG